MTKRVPIIPSLNGGELSPLMNGRVDVEKHGTGAQTLENMIPKLQGPIERRGGTVFIGETRAATARAFLPRFYFNEDQAYVLEMTENFMRFFTQRGLLEASPGVPYQIVHDYTFADMNLGGGVFRPSYVQSRDQVFFANAGFPPKVLSRLAAVDWTWTDFPYFGGPFKDQNEGEDTARLAGIVEVGQTTVMSSGGAIFQEEHEGSLFELDADQIDTLLWSVGLVVTAGSAIRWDGRFFIAPTGGTTGTIAPTHSSGTVSDGGVLWTYKHDGRCIVRIINFLDESNVDVELLTPIVGEVVHPNFTRKWAFGAWSYVEGWPTEVGFFRERLVFARGTSLWFSCAGDYTNFSARTGGLITDENAIGAQIANARADEIRWLKGAQNLLIGTPAGISILREQTEQLPFGPGNVTIIPGPAIGVADIPPLETSSGQVLYVDRTRTAIRAISYSADSETFAAQDVTRLCEHILRAGVVDIAYQAHRDSLVWCLLENGELAALTFDPGEQVFAGQRHKVSGPEAFIESIQVIPCPDQANRRDDLWIEVYRFIGQDRRYMEVFETPFIPTARQVGQTQRQYRSHVSRDVKFAHHLDSGLSFDGFRLGSLFMSDPPLPVGATAQFEAVGSPQPFTSADIGQRVQVDYTDDDGFAQMGEAEITAVEDEVATATVLFPMPDLPNGEVAAGMWKVTRSSFPGVDHLAGLEVAILADGGPRPRQIVPEDGDVVITPSAGVVKIGLPFTHRYVSMPPEFGAVAGTSQGRMKRAHRFDLRMFASLGLRAGTSEEDLKTVRDLEPYRAAETIMGRASPLFFGDARLNAPGGFDTDGLIVIAGDEPLPCTLVAVIPHFEVHD